VCCIAVASCSEIINAMLQPVENKIVLLTGSVGNQIWYLILPPSQKTSHPRIQYLSQKTSHLTLLFRECMCMQESISAKYG